MRTATAEDVQVISDINVRGWQAAFRGLFPDVFLDALNPRNRDSAFAGRVTSGPPHHTALAVDGDEVVGFVGLEPPEAEDLDPTLVHEIWGLYIEPERFGMGVGRILLDHAVDHLQTGNWKYAILWTLRDVDRTCRFYEAAGWYRDGEEKVWEIPKGNPVNLVRYRFDLINRSEGESNPKTS
ncbi:MAG: GNAT family N-acetyltransferase [Acidimicrobiia bacterium]